MRGITALALTASIIGSDAIQLQKRTDSPPKIIQHDIQRRETTMNPILRDRLRKRDTNTVTETLDNEETLYFANMTVGTPAQSLRMHLDTGSSDMWVNVDSSTYCSSAKDPCSVGGTYAPNSSSTYEYVNSLFNISYVDGSGSSGDYVTDTVRIGGATLESQQFGVGYTSSSEEGILGIGYSSNEAILAYSTKSYVNVPQKMVQDGLINTNAYSLWLNDLDASTGSILFGGVNTEKYTGSLQTVPIIADQGVYYEFLISLTAVGINGDNTSIASDVAIDVLLDSGTSLIYLPDTIASDIFTLTGAEYDSEEGAAIIDCDMANNDTTIDFTFTSPTISVSMSELVIVAGYSGKTAVCILGIAPAGDSTAVLGDTFLRSAYVVYDLYNNEISLAQTNFDSTSDNILEITNSSVPDATGVASAAAAEATSTHTSKGAAPRMTAAPIIGAGAMIAFGLLSL